MKLMEVRGKLPSQVLCPDSGVSIDTGKTGGTSKGAGKFACSACGKEQRFVVSVAKTGRSAPVSPAVKQGYCPTCHANGDVYRGRFFAPLQDPRAINAADREWAVRSEQELKPFWPTSDIPFGHMTHQRQPLPQHGYLRWTDMFNSRQLLVHTQLLRAISTSSAHGVHASEAVMSAFQQYLRNQNMFSFWNIQADKMEPMMSNANFHPKSVVIENGVFSSLGRGNWNSCSKSVLSALDWCQSPWERVSNDRLRQTAPSIAQDVKGKSSCAYPLDPPLAASTTIRCGSATDLADIPDGSMDLVVTDPPFGGLLHYSELSDFFYVWLRLVLRERYPEYFGAKYTPKTLEAVANRAREPNPPRTEGGKRLRPDATADAYYKRLLTEAWREAGRVLKRSGILTFTFHHSEDAPWIAVLDSLFEAGFYLEAIYPIRSDEKKGTGEFGSKTIEFDMIHVCRRRIETPRAVSWAKMRREVLRDVRRLKRLLEHHREEGLLEADLQVIRRGKALEYYSKHYGKVLVDDDEPMSVKEALLGINQLLDEESGRVAHPPPVNAAPFTRQFLRLFDNGVTLPQDQMHKYLRGTGYGPSDFVERGWCTHEKKAKAYDLVSPLTIAQQWRGKHRGGMVTDYDQAVFLIGACYEGSGINASETLNNARFKPHPAMGALVEWFARQGATPEIRTAAMRADQLYRGWRRRNEKKAEQMDLFFGEHEATP